MTRTTSTYFSVGYSRAYLCVRSHFSHPLCGSGLRACLDGTGWDKNEPGRFPGRTTQGVNEDQSQGISLQRDFLRGSMVSGRCGNDDDRTSHGRKEYQECEGRTLNLNLSTIACAPFFLSLDKSALPRLHLFVCPEPLTLPTSTLTTRNT